MGKGKWQDRYRRGACVWVYVILADKSEWWPAVVVGREGQERQYVTVRFIDREPPYPGAHRVYRAQDIRGAS